MPLCLAVVLCTQSAGCGGSRRIETVATIGTVSIAATTLEHWARISERTSRRPAAAARVNALNYLIVSGWIRAEAARRHVARGVSQVARQRVEDSAQASVGGPRSFSVALERSGETIADARWRAETGILYSRLEEAVVNGVKAPVPSAVAAYFRSHRRRFVSPERRFFYSDTRTSEHQLARDRALMLADRSIPSNAILENLSRSHVGTRGPARTKIERAIFSAQVGVPVGPFQNEPIEDHTIIEVTRIVPARINTFPSVEAEIRHRLMSTEQKLALATFRARWQARWRAVTRCVRPAAAPACEGSAAPGAVPLTLGL